MSVISNSQDLEAFISVVDTGGFSSAANALDEQVAKISRAVTRLEKSLNVTLFNRTTRRIELTEEGQLFLGYAREALSQLAQGEEALKLLHCAPSGKLRVDAASPFVFHQLAPHLKAFNQAYPDIKLEITSHDNIIDLLEHKTDIAIRIGELADSNLHARTLGISKLQLVASPDYLQAAPPLNELTDLASQQLIGFTDAPHLNHWPLTTPLDLKFSISASSGETVRQLCIQGHGITLLSEFMINEDLKAGRLVKVLEGEVLSPNRREKVHAVYYQNSGVSSRVLAFLDFIAPRLTL